MRRKDRLLEQKEALEIIDNCEYATISTTDEKGEIFSIPISIAREENFIYIHGATGGSKQKLFTNAKEVVMVCVSYNKVPNPTKTEFEAMKNDYKKLGNQVFTTEYKSAICKTKAYQVTDKDEKIKGLKLLCEKYTPEYMNAFEVAAFGSLKVTNVYKFEIQSLSAKAKIL